MSLKAKIEAVIYASEEPVTVAQLVGLLGQEAQAELDRQLAGQQALDLETAEVNVDAEPPADEATESSSEEEPDEPEPTGKKKVTEAEKQATRRLRDHFLAQLNELLADYATDARGLEIREVAGGYRFATKPQYHDAVRGFVKSLKPPLKLTLQALETLAVVAYKQPVTAPEISEIRGVDSSGVLGGLMARKLITTAGRKQVIGRPILYKTTKDFLLCFGLKDTSELPSIEEFEKMASELADTEPIQEEIPMETAPHQHREEENAVEPQDDGSSNVADNIILDGRLSGLPPNYEDDPSAREAAEQDHEGEE
jgi:segregation and condensation protein B